MLSGYNHSIIAESRESWASCVIGYLVDYRTLSVGLINKFVRDHWAIRGNVSVYKMGDLYIFKCSNMLDKNDIIDRSIAFFDGALMVFKEWMPNISSYTMSFTQARFWVRVYGLPFEFLNSHIAALVGSMFGKDFTMSDSTNFPGDDYLRIRVLVELDRPLLPGFYLALHDGSLVWVQFKYEGISKTCIRCGRLGHKVNGCSDTDARITKNIDMLFSEVTLRGFPTLPAENNFTMFKLDMRVPPSNSTSSVYGVRMRQDKRFRNPSVDSRIYPGSTFMQGMQPFMGPLLQPKGLEGNEFAVKDSRMKGFEEFLPVNFSKSESNVYFHCTSMMDGSKETRNSRGTNSVCQPSPLRKRKATFESAFIDVPEYQWDSIEKAYELLRVINKKKCESICMDAMLIDDFAINISPDSNGDMEEVNTLLQPIGGLPSIGAAILMKDNELKKASFSFTVFDEPHLNSVKETISRSAKGFDVSSSVMHPNDKGKGVNSADKGSYDSQELVFVKYKCNYVSESLENGKSVLTAGIKKRINSSQPDPSTVQEDVLLSVGHAKAYLSQLAKKARVMEVMGESSDLNDDLNDAASSADTSVMKKNHGFCINIEDLELLSADDAENDDVGVAEVGPTQPPRSP